MSTSNCLDDYCGFEKNSEGIIVFHLSFCYISQIVVLINFFFQFNMLHLFVYLSQLIISFSFWGLNFLLFWFSQISFTC